MIKDITLNSFKAIVAWLSAVFLVALISFSLSKMIRDTDIISYIAITAGIIMIIISYLNLKHKDSTYIEHFYIAISFAGQILIVISLSLLLKIHKIDILVFLVEAPLIFIFNNKIHKLLNATFALIALYFMLNSYNHFGLVITLALLVIIALHFRDSNFFIVTYSALIAIFWILLATKNIYLFPKLQYSTLTNILLTLPLIYLLYTIIKHYNIDTLQKQIPIYLLALFTLILSFYIKDFQIPITLLILGFFIGDLVIFSSSILLAIFVISNFYYNLNTTLLMKSLLLIASGILLLLIRFIIQKRYFND